MSGHKKSALLLHGLDPADQLWMLGQLPQHQREALKAALSELQALGIPPEAGLRAAVPAEEPVREPMREPTREDAALRQLESADAAQVHAALVDQPSELVQAFLSAHAWPWRDDVRAQWAQAGARGTGPLKDQAPAMGPALRASLIEAVAARLGQVSAPTDRGVGERGAVRRVVRRVGFSPRGVLEWLSGTRGLKPTLPTTAGPSARDRAA